MSEYLFDNPKTLCRELTESFSTGGVEGVCLISIPKAAIDAKLSVFPKPWGTYSEKLNLSKKVHSKNPKSGIKRSAEEEKILLTLKEEWERCSKDNRNLTRAQFWEAYGDRAPEVTLGAFITFCHRVNSLKGHEKCGHRLNQKKTLL